MLLKYSLFLGAYQRTDVELRHMTLNLRNVPYIERSLCLEIFFQLIHELFER